MKGKDLILVALLAFGVLCFAGQPSLTRTKLDGIVLETIWCGQENEVVFLRTDQNSVYRSEDRGANFKQITKHMQKIAQEASGEAEEIGDVANIMRVEADDKSLIFVGSAGIIWISNNCGKTMQAISSNLHIVRIKGHPTKPNLLLATTAQQCDDPDDEECTAGTHMLHLSKDSGQTWKKIRDNVHHFEWSFNKLQINEGIPEERIYATVHLRKGPTLVRSDDSFGNETALVPNCAVFQMRSTFIIATHIAEGGEAYLYVSNLRDKFSTFYRAMFPFQHLGLYDYHILDTSENVIFLLHTTGPTAKYGNLYVSDSVGVRFTLSLKDVRSSRKYGGDMMKINGLEGVYIVNVLDKNAVAEISRSAEEDSEEEEKWADEERGEIAGKSSGQAQKSKRDEMNLINIRTHTLITFNKGGSWRYLQPPKVDSHNKQVHCQGNEDCSLHLYLHESTSVPFYSHSNSRGIILATGNIGKGLLGRNAAKNVYLSRDGGLAWIEVAKGSHVYDMADHGGLLVMTKLAAERSKKPEIAYSWNEGLTWESFTVAEKNGTIEDIFTEPDSSTQHFLIRVDSLRKDNEDSSWKRYTSIYNLNFEQLHKRICQGDDKVGTPDSDYEYWSPYDGRHGQQCLLGHKISYVRRKRDKECYNGIKQEFYQSIENCDCTEEDYECDFGYDRDDKLTNSPCIKKGNISYSPPDICPSGSNYIISAGYRKIPGDTCERGIQHPPFSIPCPSSSLMSGSGLIILFLLGVIVVLLFVVGYTYQNFEQIKDKLQEVFKSKGGVKSQEFRDIKYGKIEAKVEEGEEELVIQATSKQEEKAPPKETEKNK